MFVMLLCCRTWQLLDIFAGFPKCNICFVNRKNNVVLIILIVFNYLKMLQVELLRYHNYRNKKKKKHRANMSQFYIKFVFAITFESYIYV